MDRPSKWISFLVLLISILCTYSKGNVVDITRFGAKSNGNIDNSLAFSQAWRAAYGSGEESTLFIPEGSFLLSAAVFDGPCKKAIRIEIRGQLVASETPPDTPHWIKFVAIRNLTIIGTKTSLLDGRGTKSWASHIGCRSRDRCPQYPTSLKITNVSDGIIKGVNPKDSKNFHVAVHDSIRIHLESMGIRAPWNSPNTDGIHISRSSYVNITSSVIGVGDDCILIGPGARKIFISAVFCGPGHGISVGSLGKYPGEEDVADIVIKNCTLSHTTNGVRIKTWKGKYASKAYGMVFEDIHIYHASNPVIIDQEYCPGNQCLNTSPSHVEVSNITFKGIRGLSKTEAAVTFRCSATFPCNGIKTIDIDLRFLNGSATSICLNVHGQAFGLQNPHSCL